MRTRVRVVSLRATFVIAFACLAATTAGAQTQWLDRGTRSAARLDLAYPAIGEEDEPSLSAAFWATGRVAVARDTWIVGEIPYARQRIAISYTGVEFRTVSTVGNPYLGVERELRTSGLTVELGVRPSVANAGRTDALDQGFAGGVEHEEAFVPHAVHVRTAIGLRTDATRPHRLAFAARVAPTWQIITRNPLVGVQTYYADTVLYGYARGTRQSRLLLDFATNLRFAAPSAQIAVGLAGRWTRIDVDPYSSVGYNPETNSAVELTTVLEITHAAVHPILAFRFPLDAQAKRDESPQGAMTLALSVPLGGTARRGE